MNIERKKIAKNKLKSGKDGDGVEHMENPDSNSKFLKMLDFCLTKL